MDCPLCVSSRTGIFYKKHQPKVGRKTYWKCSNCHLIFLPPEFHPTPYEEKSRYDEHENSTRNEGYVRFLEKLVQPLAAKLRPGASGLDFGCGPGAVLSALLNRRGYFVENYDPYYFPDASLLYRKYDFIASAEVVEHFRSPREVFLKLDQLLKDDESYLGLMTQILEREDNFPQWWYHNDATHLCFYQHSTLEWIAGWRQWGLEVPEKNVIIYSKGKGNRMHFGRRRQIT
ncbi:MAG: class I SAM-dependent methyltransferase [Candidatus Omnitrophica bacterium]|nr:class I SAM-dependent methyltransferase [Candidatus Omnitrophota bacterium]